MPKKIRQPIKDYKSAGFQVESAKWSHRKLIHSDLARHWMLSGGEGDGAKKHQESDLSEALEALKGNKP